MSNDLAPITFTSFAGGLNDTDPPLSLQPDQCTTAMNVEFFQSPMGERRKGMGAAIGPGAGTSVGADSIVHIGRWFSTNDAFGVNLLTIAVETSDFLAYSVRARSINNAWSIVTPVDDLDLGNSGSSKFPTTGSVTPNPDVFGFTSVGLNGRLFLSYHNSTNTDRLHLWDGTAWRRTGLAQPAAAPTGADSGGGGAFAGVRYYRVRYIVKSGSTILYRSEPSAVLTATPSGANASYTVTKPATISENETHWELEASTDNVNFYILATTVVGTTTVVDSTAYATGYSANVLSEQIGLYLTQPSAKYLAVEGDRLIMGGHWSDASLYSQVAWTPVKNDPGVGNDERLPLNSLFNNRISLDNYDHGGVTGLSNGVNGTFYAFKWTGVYRFTRTGNLTRAYDISTVSKIRGALPGSIINGMDENNRPCVYFLDPRVGPCRINASGAIERILGVRNTWSRVNTSAAYILARGIYYGYKDQVHWWVPVDGGNFPALKLVLQVSKMRSGDEGLYGCWSLADGVQATALCATMVFEYGRTGTPQDERPWLGFSTVINGSLSNMPYRADIGDDDAGTAFTATLVSRPFSPTTLLTRLGALRAEVASAPSQWATMTLSLVRDCGVETSATVSASSSPTGTETVVLSNLDNLQLSGNTMLQLQVSD